MIPLCVVLFIGAAVPIYRRFFKVGRKRMQVDQRYKEIGTLVGVEQYPNEQPEKYYQRVVAHMRHQVVVQKIPYPEEISQKVRDLMAQILSDALKRGE